MLTEHIPGKSPVVGFIRKKKKPRTFQCHFYHLTIPQTRCLASPHPAALRAAYLDASELSNYLDNFEGTRVELFDTVVPQQLPAPFQTFSQALVIVFVLHGI